MTQTSPPRSAPAHGPMPVLTGNEPYFMVMNTGSGRHDAQEIRDGKISFMQSPLVFKVAEHQLPLLVTRDPALRENA